MGEPLWVLVLYMSLYEVCYTSQFCVGKTSSTALAVMHVLRFGAVASIGKNWKNLREEEMKRFDVTLKLM